MIRKLAIFWLGPIVVFWGWYYLAVNDVGLIFFTRQTHDEVFGIYAALLGVEPERIAPMIAKSLFVDSLIVAAILAFRQRRAIAAALRRGGETRRQPGALSEEILSKAP